MNVAQFTGATQCVTEPRHHQLVAALQTRYELLPHRAQPLVFGQFLYHLNTAVLLHPSLVFCILFAIGGDKDVTYFLPYCCTLLNEIKCKGTLFFPEKQSYLNEKVILKHDNLPFSFHLISLKIILASMIHK